MNSLKFKNILQSFYKYQVWVFKLFGLWKLPKETKKNYRLFYDLYFWYIVIIWMLLFDTTLFIQFISNITHMNEIIKVFFIFATSLAVLAKFSSIKLKNTQYQELVDNIQRHWFRPANCREEKFFMNAVRLSQRVRNSYCFLSLCALNVVMLTQYIADNTELPLSAYTPINLDRKWRYVMMYLYQYFAVSLCCYMNIAFDSLSASLLIHVNGQLDILNDRIDNLDSYCHGDDDNDEKIHLKLKNFILYHAEILRLANMIEELVKFPISMQIGCSVLVLIANFYAMSFLSKPGDYANFIKFLIYQICMLAQIFILCFYSNEVTLKSAQLSYSLYLSNWVTWSKPNRKLLLLMMLMFDTPIRIRGIIRNYCFNLAAFTSIVNSSYSYFALLKNINN